jgi:hypothetical protein
MPFSIRMRSASCADKRSRLSAGPFCPMLSQGWGLLRVRNVWLPPSVAPAAGHLLRSLWTMLDSRGMQLVIDALSAGQVS